MDNDYSKRELDVKFSEVHHRFDDLSKDMGILIGKVSYTNGKVAAISIYQERAKGALGVVLVILIPILSWALWKIQSIDEIVENGVRSELSNYEIQIR